MAIDPSIILSGQSQVSNPLQTLLGYSALKGQALQQKGIEQQQQTNQIVSEAMKQAIDPNTGQVNTGLLSTLIAKSPAAYNLPQIQAQILQQQNAQQDFDTKQFDLAHKRTQSILSTMGSLVSKPDLTQKDVLLNVANAIKDGTTTAEQAVRYTQDLPSDPGQLRQWVQQKFVQGLEDNAKLEAIMPKQQVLNTGGQQQIINTNPLTGAPSLAGTVNNTLAPGEAAQPTKYFDPQTGTERSIPLAQYAAMTQGGAPGVAQAPGATGPLGTGRITAPAQAGAPGLQTGPALGQQAAADIAATGAAKNSLALQGAADNAPQAIYQLQNMRTALNDFTPGPTSDWRAQAQALALGVAPGLVQKFGLDPQRVASQEEFKKFSTQLAQGTASNLGEGTDSKLASAVAANPNTSLSKLGNQQIIDVLIASQRGIAAKNQAWQNSGLPPEQYNKFSSNWNRDVDPRVFAVQDMDQAHVKKMVEGLPVKDQIEFARSWQKAQAAGYVQ